MDPAMVRCRGGVGQEGSGGGAAMSVTCVNFEFVGDGEDGRVK